MKSKSTAYLLWLFVGFAGGHKFYLEKIGIGVLYFFTFGLFGIGWFIDLFTLGNQVDKANKLSLALSRLYGENYKHNVVVNVNAPTASAHSLAPTKKNPQQEILKLSIEKNQLSIRDMIIKTGLGVNELEEILKLFVEKGLARETVDANGKILYDFS